MHIQNTNVLIQATFQFIWQCLYVYSSSHIFSVLDKKKQYFKSLTSLNPLILMLLTHGIPGSFSWADLQYTTLLENITDNATVNFRPFSSIWLNIEHCNSVNSHQHFSDSVLINKRKTTKVVFVTLRTFRGSGV